MGGHLLGWRTVCAVEFDPYARGVLLARQRDGMLPRFPVWDDVRTFDGKPWRGHAQVVSGGFPCTDISAAGQGAGIDGAASGLWLEMARIVCEVRPEFVFVENSPMLTTRGLWRVLGDLAALGFDARWGVLGAAATGAPHERERIWIVAHAQGERRGEAGQLRHDEPSQWPAGSGEAVHDANGIDRQQVRRPASREGRHAGEPGRGVGRHGADQHWPVEPDVGRVAYGVANRVDRLRCLGNGQVPRVAAAAWRVLTGGVMNTHNVAIKPRRQASA